MKCHLSLPWKVYSFSGEATLPEQVASIRSFLKWAGHPICFTIVSDGSISERSRILLESLHPSVKVAVLDDIVSKSVLDLHPDDAEKHVVNKKIPLLLSISDQSPAIYTDSDILFFAGANLLLNSVLHESAPASYLLDYCLSADDRMLINEEERLNPVNSGFLCFRSGIDWSLPIERLKYAASPPHYFADQTFTHLAMHANGATPLPKNKYILACDDQFIYRDNYVSADIALRHYVNPVRHKFWVAASWV